MTRIVILIWLVLGQLAFAQDRPDATTASKTHMALAQQPTGLLIPLYLYPSDIHTNKAFNRLVELKLAHPKVPVCVILDPDNGPGKQADANYKYAARRLRGAGQGSLWP